LMTVDAAVLDDFAGGRIPFHEHWRLEGRFLLAVPAMSFQGIFHGKAQTRQRVPCVGTLGITAAVAPVNETVGVHEKRGPGQIMIKIENVQVESGDLQKPYPHERVRHSGDLVQTNNLLVPLMAIPSGIAAEDEKDWLAGLSSDRFGPVQIDVPAELAGELSRFALREGGTGTAKEQ
jgi:hypothetical protein